MPEVKPFHNERKLSRNCNRYLNLNNMACMSLSYNMHDCLYWINAKETTDDFSEISPNDFFYEYATPKFGDKTIFHIMATKP